MECSAVVLFKSTVWLQKELKKTLRCIFLCCGNSLVNLAYTVLSTFYAQDF